MLDSVPAPASTTIGCLPLAASFLTVSGVAATRVSPGRVSRGMPMIIAMAPCFCLVLGLVLCGYLATKASPIGLLRNRLRDCLAQSCRRRLTAEIGRPRRARVCKHPFDRADDCRCGFGLPEVLEHQRGRPYLTDGIGDAL